MLDASNCQLRTRKQTLHACIVRSSGPTTQGTCQVMSTPYQDTCWLVGALLTPPDVHLCNRRCAWRTRCGSLRPICLEITLSTTILPVGGTLGERHSSLGSGQKVGFGPSHREHGCDSTLGCSCYQDWSLLRTLILKQARWHSLGIK